MFKIEALSKDEYREVQVPFDLEASSRRKGKNSWNGLRQHHLVVETRISITGREASVYGDSLSCTEVCLIGGGSLVKEKMGGICRKSSCL